MKTGSKRGGKLSYTQMVMLGLLTFCCQIRPAEAATVQAAVQISARTSFVLPLIFMLVMLGSSKGVSNRTA